MMDDRLERGFRDDFTLESSSAPLEELRTAVPGPRSLELGTLLSAFEAREITYIGREFPVFWEEAAGSTVVDADGNRYLDFGAAFGVAAVGHANPRVVAAIVTQTKRLLHGMGDVHPTAVRAKLLARLAAVAPGRLSMSFLGLNGADAVEFARKTAFLVNGRPGALRYAGGYHGLSYGTLDLCGLERFRTPWNAQLRNPVVELPYPTIGTQRLDEALTHLEATLRAHPEIGMIIIEPIAGRAGTLMPIDGYLRGLRDLATRYGCVLVFDEIYTGFGRTGKWFACQHDDVVPDLLCLGKALGGGMPLSATIGTPEMLNAWPQSTGEALHTATFLGSPVACAAALAVIEELEQYELPRRAAALGLQLGHLLRAMAARLSTQLPDRVRVRGRGLMWAIDVGNTELAQGAMVRALTRGLIILQQGVAGTALAITPPLTIARRQLERGVTILEAAIVDARGSA